MGCCFDCYLIRTCGGEKSGLVDSNLRALIGMERQYCVVIPRFSKLSFLLHLFLYSLPSFASLCFLFCVLTCLLRLSLSLYLFIRGGRVRREGQKYLWMEELRERDEKTV